MIEPQQLDFSKQVLVDDGLEKIFWIISNTKYDQFCKIKGCKNYTGLESAQEDINQIMNLAKGYGVKMNENLFIDLEADATKLKETHKQIYKRSTFLS